MECQLSDQLEDDGMSDLFVVVPVSVTVKKVKGAFITVSSI